MSGSKFREGVGSHMAKSCIGQAQGVMALAFMNYKRCIQKERRMGGGIRQSSSLVNEELNRLSRSRVGCAWCPWTGWWGVRSHGSTHRVGG